MIYQCTRCNEEMNLKKGARICPYCGAEIRPVNITKRVAQMYNEGKSIKEISAELMINDISVSQSIARAAALGLIPVEGLIQDEYEEDIKNAMSDDWDGRLKTIKAKVAPECSYTTINYYIYKAREEHKAKTREKIPKIIEAAHEGKTVNEISDELCVSKHLVERIILEEIEKDEEVSRLYINEDHEKEILVAAARGDGRLRTIKEDLPEDVTFIEIRAVLARNGIEFD